MIELTWLINAAETRPIDFSTASADEVHAAMRECIEKLNGNTHALDVTVVVPSSIYNKNFRYRFRRCRVKKGCGQYRHVVIGPARLSLRRSK